MSKLQIAREFRKEPTKSEKIMWNSLRNRQFLNLKFRRQYLIQGFIVDFYCPELKLAIEIDGSIHLKQNQIKYDKERQNVIEQQKVEFIRINSKEVENDIGEVLGRLYAFLNKPQIKNY